MENQTQHQIISTNWIENLALEEINMEESGIIQFHDHLDPQSILEESSVKLVDQIRERFEIYVEKFNEFRMATGNGIRIFKISNTVNDFMLFRNSLKLVVARKSVDLISIGFLSNSGGLFSARVNKDTPAANAAHEVRAHIGPFNKVTWTFNGERIDVDSMVKHYLGEFIRHSAK